MAAVVAAPSMSPAWAVQRQAGDMLGAPRQQPMLGHLLALQRGERGPASCWSKRSPRCRSAGDDRLAGPERATAPAGRGARVHFLGQIRLGQADLDRAAQLFSEGLNAARSAQDRFTILISLYDLALSSQAQGDLTGAAERLQEGVSQSAEARDEPSVADSRGAGRGRHPAGQPRARRASARRRRRAPASQGQRLAARAGPPCRPRRWSPGRAALPHGRCGIRAGLDAGTVPGRQPRR